MNALVLKGKNEALQYETLPQLEIKAGQCLVQIKAAALNHRDAWIQKGHYPGIHYPIILGSDGAGLVNEKEVIINPSMNWTDNQAFQPKDYRILGLPDNGTFATELVVDEKLIHEKPEHLNWEEAAALPLAGLTAYRALFTKCQAKAGDKVLISGVGGGVALFACQFAIAAGCEVFVTSGHDEKIEKAVTLGAKGGANYRKKDWRKALAAQTSAFDVIIDSAGGSGFMELVKLADFGGRICFYGGTRGNIEQLNPQIVFWKQLSIYGSTMGNHGEFEKMLRFVAEKKIRPVVDQVFELKDGNAALEKMNAGKQFGKLVLTCI